MKRGAANAKPKPTIAIKLKSKKMKKPKVVVQEPKAAAGPPAAPVVSKVEKERIANIEKWNETQAQLKAEAATAAGKTPDSAAASISSSSSTNIRTTAKGEPICTICKRKFPNVEKLRLHERVSELHKTNLAKLAAAANGSNNSESSSNSVMKRKEPPLPVSGDLPYTDRAQKRRDMHGGSGGDAPSRPIQEKVSHGPAVPASESLLGSSNIGNQMLKKMGWDAARDETASGPQQDIRKDWQRIESLASRQNN